MVAAFAFGTVTALPVCGVCSKSQQRRVALKAPQAAHLVRTAVSADRPDMRCTANIETAQAAVFSPAVHDSDVTGTTTTANTNTVTDSLAFAEAMAQIADDTKGQDIMLLHVEPLSSWTSYMLLVTVSSRPQLNAVLAKIEKEAELPKWQRPRTHKSPGGGTWEVLDFGDVVVHIMSAEKREYYDLEGFYGAAEEVELSFATQAGAEDGLQWTQKY